MNTLSTLVPLLRRSLLGVATLALLGATACDPEGSDDLDREATELEDAASQPLDRVPTGPQSLTADQDAPVTASTYIQTYEGGHTLGFLADGDIVMLKNFSRGYLGCDGAGDTLAQHSPVNTDSYVWEVHLVDIDGDGTDEVQLEQAGGTDVYLKMDNADDVFCGTISGIGDAAAWNLGTSYAGAGALYKRVTTTIVNYKQAQCLRVDANGVGAGVACNSNQDAVFFLEVVASV